MDSRISTWSLLACAAAIGGSGIAGAQQPAREAGATGLEEVVVTARKTEERLQEVPLAITALTGEQMLQRNVQGLQDIAALTPGLNYEDYLGGNGMPVIRGAAQNRITDLDQNVSTFFDGIYLPRQYVLNTGVVGLERIEVVKGPQSALYGRNAFMGAINYVTRKPDETLRGSVEATFGDNERRDGIAELSGPIVRDKLFARIGIGYSEYDGDAKNYHPNAGANIHPGSPGRLGGWQHKALQARVVFRPVESLEFDVGAYRFDIFEETRAAIRVQRSTGDTNCSRVGGVNKLWCGELPFRYKPLPGGPALGDVVFDPRSYGLDLTTNLLRGHVEWKARENLNVVYEYGKLNTYAVSAGTSDRDPILGQANFLNPRAPFGNQVQASPNGDVNYRSNEVRVEYSPTESVDLLAGYFDSQLKDYDYFPIAGGLPLMGTQPIDLNSSAFLVFSRGRTTVDAKGYFARVNWKVTDRLRLGAEGRQAEEEKWLVSGPAGFVPTVRVLNDSWSNFTPRFTADYKLSSENMLYASIAKGVKSGGFNLSAIVPEQFRFEEDENWTYELGSKNTLLGGKLRLNAAVFRINWSNQQVNCSALGSTSITPPAVICNIGKAYINGFEFEGAYALTRNLTLNFGGAWNDAKYASGAISDRTKVAQLCDNVVCAANGAIGGNQLNRMSKVHGLAGLQLEMPIGSSLGFFTNFDATYKSKQYADEMNLAYLPARTLANLRLGVRGERWEVAAWSKNLFDREYAAASYYIANATDTVYIPIWGQRRTFGLTARYTF